MAIRVLMKCFEGVEATNEGMKLTAAYFYANSDFGGTQFNLTTEILNGTNLAAAKAQLAAHVRSHVLAEFAVVVPVNQVFLLDFTPF